MFSALVAWDVGCFPSKWQKSKGEWPVVGNFPDGGVADLYMLNVQDGTFTQNMINDTVICGPHVSDFRSNVEKFVRIAEVMLRGPVM